jgi:hypothetical protein
LRSPSKKSRVSNLFDDEVFNYISAVHINGNDSDNFDSQVFGEWSSDTVNKVFDSSYNLDSVFFHGCLTSSVKFIKSSNGFFCPHDLGSEKSNLSTVVLKPLMSFSVRDLPVISCLFSNFKLISKVGLHTFLEITKIVLDGTSHYEFSTEWNILVFFGVHTHCSLGWIWNSWAFNEFKAFHSIKAISKIVIDFLWVVTIRKNVKQSLVRNEIESSENLFLLLKVLVQGFFADFNLRVEVIEKFLSSFMKTGGDDTWFVSSFFHHFSELVVNCFESPGIIWKLCSDIFGSTKDRLKSLPVALSFVPDLDN